MTHCVPASDGSETVTRLISIAFTLLLYDFLTLTQLPTQALRQFYRLDNDISFSPINLYTTAQFRPNILTTLFYSFT
jgi:hypothetical protein